MYKAFSTTVVKVSLCDNQIAFFHISKTNLFHAIVSLAKYLVKTILTYASTNSHELFPLYENLGPCFIPLYSLSKNVKKVLFPFHFAGLFLYSLKTAETRGFQIFSRGIETEQQYEARIFRQTGITDECDDLNLHMLDDTSHTMIIIQCNTHLAGEVLYLHQN